MEQMLQLFSSAQITCESQNWVEKEGAESSVMGHVDRGRANKYLEMILTEGYGKLVGINQVSNILLVQRLKLLL